MITLKRLGVAIHVRKELLFVSDSDGYVRRLSLKKNFTNQLREIVVSPFQVNFKPYLLSVDWLNERLYILGEVNHPVPVWQIAHCNLHGEGLTVAVAGLRIKPHDMQVDPYNG